MPKTTQPYADIIPAPTRVTTTLTRATVTVEGVTLDADVQLAGTGAALTLRAVRCVPAVRPRPQDAWKRAPQPPSVGRAQLGVSFPLHLEGRLAFLTAGTLLERQHLGALARSLNATHDRRGLRVQLDARLLEVVRALL